MVGVLWDRGKDHECELPGEKERDAQPDHTWVLVFRIGG